MALINCPECGKEISDKAKVCINCGFPLDDLDDVIDSNDENIFKYKGECWDFTECKKEILELTDSDMKNLKYTPMSDSIYEVVFKDNNEQDGVFKSISIVEYIHKHKRVPESWDVIKRNIERNNEYNFTHNGRKYDLSKYKNTIFSLTNSQIQRGEYKVLMENIRLEVFFDEEDSLNGRVMALNLVEYIYTNKTIPKNYNEAHADYQRRVNASVQAKQSLKPKCPTCGSTNLEKISDTKKVAGALMFGLLSKTAKSQFKCRNCGYKW